MTKKKPGPPLQYPVRVQLQMTQEQFVRLENVRKEARNAVIRDAIDLWVAWKRGEVSIKDVVAAESR